MKKYSGHHSRLNVQLKTDRPKASIKEKDRNVWYIAAAATALNVLIVILIMHCPGPCSGEKEVIKKKDLINIDSKSLIEKKPVIRNRKRFHIVKKRKTGEKIEKKAVEKKPPNFHTTIELIPPP